MEVDLDENTRGNRSIGHVSSLFLQQTVILLLAVKEFSKMCKDYIRGKDSDKSE
jgi:hypothetical protein